MAARVPLDVDLEDKLLYGLTTMRLGYLVFGLLGAFSTWSAHWAPSPMRAGVAVVICAAAALSAWGRWRGRAVDAWVVDIATFVLTNYRVVRARRPP